MKKRISTAVAVLAILALVAVGASATNGNLVVNGDFEIPVVAASQMWDIYDSGYTGLGWTVEWRSDVPASWGGWTRPDPAHLELHRGAGGWLPYDGSQHAEMDTDWNDHVGSLQNEPASVKIYQNLATCPGETYTLQYAWSPRPNHGNNALEVWWDGAKIDTHTGSGGSNTAWTVPTWTLTASTEWTQLAFVEVGTNDALGMFLDAVSVVGPTHPCVIEDEPCIDLEKTGPETAEFGDEITYHFRVHNCGNVGLHTGAQVYDELFGGDPIWKGDLEPDEFHEFDMPYKLPDECEAFTNTAWAVGYPPDGEVRDESSWTVSINLESKRLVPVAVLSTDDFDASTVDPRLVKFACASPVCWTLEDVDGDGDMDKLFHFKTEDLNLNCTVPKLP